MAAPAPPPAPAPRVALSVRQQLARAALHAAERTPGVVGGHPGPSRLCMTSDPVLGALVGVGATAESDGRYAVTLSLIARPVPLHALAEQVRGAVVAAAAARGLADRLGAVDVMFADVEEPVT